MYSCSRQLGSIHWHGKRRRHTTLSPLRRLWSEMKCSLERFVSQKFKGFFFENAGEVDMMKEHFQIQIWFSHPSFLRIGIQYDKHWHVKLDKEDWHTFFNSSNGSRFRSNVFILGLEITAKFADFTKNTGRPEDPYPHWYTYMVRVHIL